MPRDLTDWELAVVRALAAVDGPGMAQAREAIDHLVVTGECGCGCGSFSLQDRRHPAGAHELRHVANGVSSDVGFAFFLGADGIPAAVDVLLPDDRPLAERGLPRPEDIEVSPD